MGSDVLRRVRWGNVALACAVLAALAGVVVWPLFTASAPSLPPDAARPLVTDEPGRAEERPRGVEAARRPERRDRATATGRERRPAKRRKARSGDRGDASGGKSRRPGSDGAAKGRRPDGNGAVKGRDERGSAGQGGRAGAGNASHSEDARRGRESGRRVPPRRAVPRPAPQPGVTGGEFGFEG